jgi:ATPase subunit of ABC transporter with duplicated ATPase domains
VQLWIFTRPQRQLALPSGKSAMLDQRVSLLDRTASIRDNFRRINPAAEENACRAALARFMFRADAALQIVSDLSGGELLRAGFACVLGGTAPPSLLLLDEPTNHLDVYSMETVEAGLRGYDGALLVVSHKEAFFGGHRDFALAGITAAHAKILNLDHPEVTTVAVGPSAVLYKVDVDPPRAGSST